MSPDTLLTRKELAAYLKATERQVERWRVPRFALSRKVTRYRLRDVQAWLEQRARTD
jgi:hypothetical protein